MDVFLVSVATKDELELGSSDQITCHMLDVVAYNTLGSGEITDRHLNNPALCIRQVSTPPQFDVFLHGNVFRLPVVVLHGLIQIISPLVFQWQDIEEHRILTINDFFCSKSFRSLRFVKYEGFIADCIRFFHV
jgi:hypothetical protein